MEKIIPQLILILSAALLSPDSIGQIKVYVNKATEEFKPVMHGDYEKTTDRYERATVKITKTGPIKYTINPADLLIFENETKKWTGMIYPDFKTFPAPGDSANATIEADYTLVFSRPEPIGGPGGLTVLDTYSCGKCAAHPTGGKHEVVRQNGNKQFDFTLYSIDLQIPDTLVICGKSQFLHVKSVFPEGGKLTWEDDNPAMVVSVGPGTSLKIDYNPKHPTYYATSKIFATYTIGDVSITKRCIVKMGSRSPEQELTELKKIFCESVDEIRPSFPTLGKGYLGNVQEGEGLCLIVNDSIKTHVKAKQRGQTFCHYQLAAATYYHSKLLGWGHTFSCIRDRDGKVYLYADPWKFNDCHFRKPPASSKDWIITDFGSF